MNLTSYTIIHGSSIVCRSCWKYPWCACCSTGRHLESYELSIVCLRRALMMSGWSFIHMVARESQLAPLRRSKAEMYAQVSFGIDYSSFLLIWDSRSWVCWRRLLPSGLICGGFSGGMMGLTWGWLRIWEFCWISDDG